MDSPRVASPRPSLRLRRKEGWGKNNVSNPLFAQQRGVQVAMSGVSKRAGYGLTPRRCARDPLYRKRQKGLEKFFSFPRSGEG